jgi:hypothetical protein
MNASQREPLVPSAFVRQIDTEDGAALLDLHQNVCFSINPVGAKIWELLKQGYPATEIAARLIADYGIGELQASHDVSEFMNSLRDHHLLTYGAAKPPRLFERLRAFARYLKDLRLLE